MLCRIGVCAWKVASGETNNLPLLEAMLDTKLPILLSSGMSTIQELDRSISLIRQRGHPLALFQCTNRYPCPPQCWGLNLISFFKERYGVPVGFSDHSGTVAAGLAAAALSVCMIEVHVCWHKSSFGPDISSSLTPEELALMVKGVRDIEKALANPVDKDSEARELTETRRLFTKSIVAKEFIRAGTVLDRHHLTCKKPNMGIAAADLNILLGKRLSCDVEADQFIQWDMLN